MQWWCAATASEWAWVWRPYPGVWLFIALLAGAYAIRFRALNPQARRWHQALRFGLGLALLWAALDWPIGTLGAGYLLSVHSAQYVLITAVAVPTILAGMPPAFFAATTPLALSSPSSVLGRLVPASPPLLRRMTHPGLGLLAFSVVMGMTHVPAISDSLMASQPGSLLIDLLWLAGAGALWWPVLAPEGLRRMSPPLRIGYLFGATIPPTVPAAFLVFADFPLYALFELAPRVHGIPAAADQQVAGLIMKAGMDPLIWLGMAIIFFRWRIEEDDG